MAPGMDSGSIPTASWVVNTETPSQSAAASLHGHKAKTPIIAGCVSAVGVILIWAVSYWVYLIKKKKKKARIAAGQPPHRHPKDATKETYIIPPDPAVLQGHHPGEVALSTVASDREGGNPHLSHHTHRPNHQIMNEVAVAPGANSNSHDLLDPQ